MGWESGSCSGGTSLSVSFSNAIEASSEGKKMETMKLI